MVKTRLKKLDLQPFVEAKSLEVVQSGCSDSVYCVNGDLILKLYENACFEDVQEEIKLLDLCQDLCVARVVSKPFVLHNKPALFFKRCKGTHIQSIKNVHIQQIAEFLKQLHGKTEKKTLDKPALFAHDRLEKMVLQTRFRPFIKQLQSVQIHLKDEGIIHGDLFVDNALFCSDRLCCVIDFAQSCNGDFSFDLAVAALSWCKNADEVQLLLHSYGFKRDSKEFANYIEYARLYYCSLRFLEKREFMSLWEKRL
ncbi:MAG: phosphotransferase [Campylobacterota bacterium]